MTMGTAHGLAMIIIIGSIVIMLFLVFIHLNTLSESQKTFTAMFNQAAENKSLSTMDLFESFQNYYREANASNINLFTVLLPVIGAWVGAILAFYYGNKNIEKVTESMTETIKAAANPEEKLANLKVWQILERYRQYKEVIKAKISESVGDGYSLITRPATNLLLTDDNNKPLGILYKTDLTRNTSLTEDDISAETSSFSDFFKAMKKGEPNAQPPKPPTPIVDLITEKEWSDQGVQNYAEIDKDFTLLQARDKMKAQSTKQEIKGLVLEGDKVIGIIPYELFSTVLTQEK